MIASSFTRDWCTVGEDCKTYTELTREWRCNDCGGRLTMRNDGNGWYVACGLCHSFDFIHERQYRREQQAAFDVLDGAPVEWTQWD